MLPAALTLAVAMLGRASEARDLVPEVAPPTRLQKVTVTKQNDTLVFHVKTAGPARYRTTFLEEPYRVVVDLEDTVYAWRKTPLAVDREPVREVRGAQYQGGVARVVVELTRKVGYVVRTDDAGLAIIVPLVAADGAGAAAPTAKPRQPKAGTTVAGRSQPLAQLAARELQPASQRPLISLEFKDADIVNLLRTLAAEGGRNIIIGEDVKGKMSISLRNVTSEMALQVILEARSLERIERDGIIRIVTREQLTKEAEAAVKMREAEAKLVAQPQLRGPLREESIRLYYTDAEEVAKTLQGILGIAAGSTPAAAGGGAGPIAEPPFSQLFRQPGAPAAEAPATAAPEVFTKGLTIRAHKPTNTLFLRLYEADLERVKKLIAESLDIPLPQVKIEARMEILEREALEQIGIQWSGADARQVGNLTLVGQGFDGGAPAGIPPVGLGTLGNPNLTLGNLLPISATNGLPLGGNLVNLPISALPNATGSPTAGLAFGLVGRRFNINLALQALASQRKTHTLARPEVVTVENNNAVMTVGQEIPYATVSSAGTQIQFKEAALRLEVTPSVIREGDLTKIKLKVIVENNSPGAAIPLGSAGSPPAINKRRAETLVIMKEGDHLIIGGVMQRLNDNTIRKVPLFGDIPLLGWLFKQREQRDTGTELVVFLTPTVLPVDRGTAAAASSQRPTSR
jgi:type IV pilus assembly protein PilQ